MSEVKARAVKAPTVGALVARAQRLSSSDPVACLADMPGTMAAIEASGDESALMRMSFHAGSAHQLLSQDAEALAHMQRTLEIARTRGDRQWEARAIGGLGSVHGCFGDNESAIDLLEESLAIRREIGDADGIARALSDLGITFHEMGLFPERARELLHEAYAIFAELRDRHGMSATLCHLVALDVAESEQHAATDPDIALAMAEAAARTANEAVRHARANGGNLRLLGETLVHEARALTAAQRLDQADARIAEATIVHGRVQTLQLRLSLALCQGRLHRLRGASDEAVRVLTAGLEAATDLLRGSERVDLLTELVAVHEGRGDLAQALATHRELLVATLQHRDDSAERRARALNAQRDVERARMAAEVERLRSEQLELANRVLAHEAMHDALTGLANRRSFDAALLSHTAAPESRLTCVIGDLDHFKLVNDTYSHLVGDEVLRRVGQILTTAVRGTDLVARLGGEELAVLLSDSDDDGDTVIRVCERIRASVEQHPWEEVAPGLRVTMSLGAATRTAGETGESLVARADELLYAAKAGGRNRAVVAAR